MNAKPRVLLGIVSAALISTSVSGGPVDNLPQTAKQPPADNTEQSAVARTPQQGGDASTPQSTDEIYEAAKRSLIPVAPEQVKDFRHAQDAANAAALGGPMPELVNREVRLVVGPGMDAPTISLAPGFVTSVLFVDATGAPWPIRWLHGAKEGGRFSMSWTEEYPANLITVKPLQNHISGNVVVTLNELDMPINVLFDVDSKNEHGLFPPKADGTITVKVMKAGPNAVRSAVVSSPAANINSIEYSFLYETPPAEAEEIELRPSLGRAWLYEGRIFYRSASNLIWPAYTGVVNGQGGVRVYELGLVPLLMISRDGRKVSISLDTTNTSLSGEHYGG